MNCYVYVIVRQCILYCISFELHYDEFILSKINKLRIARSHTTIITEGSATTEISYALLRNQIEILKSIEIRQKSRNHEITLKS